MKTRSHFPLLLFLLPLFSLATAACGGGATEAKFPTGKFADPNDRFRSYNFFEDGTWTYIAFGSIEEEGTYTVEGNKWIENGTAECPFPGTYEWAFDGSNLTFKLVGEDACEGRRITTDGSTWVLAKE